MVSYRSLTYGPVLVVVLRTNLGGGLLQVSYLWSSLGSGPEDQSKGRSPTGLLLMVLSW